MQGHKELFMKLFGVRQAFFQCLHAREQKEPVHPGQGPILAFLLHHSGESQADIVRMMRVSAATVAVSVARLEKLGFVTRERNQANQRANVLKLTERGRKVAIDMERTMERIAAVALDGFDEVECKIMENYCQRIVENLQSKCEMKE